MSLGTRACAMLVSLCLGVACGDDAAAPTADTTDKAADALMRSLSFDGAMVRRGELPASTDTVTLGLAAQLAELEPGAASLLPLEVENPEAADNPEEFVLLQFEGRADHLAVPVTSGVDGPGDLNLDFSVDDEACSELCAKRFEVGMLCAMELEDGEVSGRWTIDLVLDCRELGDRKLCRGGVAPDDEPGADSGAGPAQDRDDAGGAGTGADQPLDGGAVDPIDVGGPTDAGMGLPPDDAFPCGNANEMIDLDQLCDGVMDCSDGWDELLGCVPCSDGVGMFSSAQFCDDVMHCADGTDELTCSYPCSDGSDAPLDAACNGTEECADGSDELPAVCNPQYPCSDGSGSVPVDQVCDGSEDCPDGSDEPEGACG